MKGQDYYTVLLTFGMGFVAGFYLFLVGFLPEYSNGNWLPEFRTGPPQAVGLAIIGDMYGGCARASACASFQLNEDRSYRYIPSLGAEVRTGVVPEALLRTLTGAIERAPLDRYAVESAASGCASYVDGTDYRYQVKLNGEEYFLDTCKTEFPSGSATNQSLTTLWQYFKDQGFEMSNQE